jgi:hypothetical protein
MKAEIRLLFFYFFMAVFWFETSSVPMSEESALLSGPQQLRVDLESEENTAQDKPETSLLLDDEKTTDEEEDTLTIHEEHSTSDSQSTKPLTTELTASLIILSTPCPSNPEPNASLPKTLVANLSAFIGNISKNSATTSLSYWIMVQTFCSVVVMMRLLVF